MKILYIITQGELGGAQRYVLDLARNFNDKNEVIVANGKQGEQWLKTRCDLSNIKTYQFDHLVREINPIKDFLAFFEIKKYIQEIKPDLIHVNSTKAGVLVAFAKGKVPSIYTVHGWVFNEPMNWFKKQFYILIEKFSCRKHNKIIVLGENNKKDCLRLKIGSTDKIEIISHGIKQNKLPATSYKLQANETHLVTIANFYKTKGLEYLIEAINKLENTQLTIFGDGPERQTIESLIKDKEKIKLAGRRGEAKFNLYWNFDIFVLPSLKEGFPYVILEAMDAEVPIVATTVGEIPNILENEKTALLVEPSNPEDLANAIKKLIAEPALRKNLATNAKKRLADFSFATMIIKHEQVYQELLLKRSKGAQKI